MSFYSELAVVAKEVLQEFGASGTLRSKGVASYDPAEGIAEEPLPVDQAVFAAVFDIENKMVNGTNILSGDKTGYVTVVSGVQPVVGDQLIWGSETLDVVKTDIIAPAREAVLYVLQLRKP